MADWRDSLLDASIGGVPLFVKDVKTTSGRRTAVREMPKRDAPAVEDLGRKARRYSVTGYVIGPNYMADRDAVMAVLEGPGPYMFRHPWQGDKSVVLDEGSALEVHESDTEGGWARLSFSLAESGEKDGLRVTVSTSAALSKASAAVLATAPNVTKNLKLHIGDVFAAASAAIGKVSSTLMQAKRKVMGALGVADAGRLTDAIADLGSNAGRLLNTPAELLTTISGLVAATLALVRDQGAEVVATYPGGGKALRVEASLEAAQALATVETVTPAPFPGGPVNPDAQAAQAAIGKVLKLAAVAHAADLFGVLPLESSQTAAQVLETLGALLEELLLDPTTDDDMFAALTDVKAGLDAHLAGLAASLPTIQTYTPPASTPALLVAFWLYGDPTRDLEIAGRNRVRDPNFLPGGEPLEVLVDA